jgi:hypothetical protein
MRRLWRTSLLVRTTQTICQLEKSFKLFIQLVIQRLTCKKHEERWRC